MVEVEMAGVEPAS